MEIVSHILSNGLRVLVNQDKSSPLAAMNIVYDVGARDEDPELTGFAHLFEHLMFGGSINIPDFDKPLQLAGGENNAFTNNDITNFYLNLPARNIETGFWLESDRMMSLDFSQKGLDIQKKVVIEEFKQRYLNQPYGDVWLNLRPLAYKKHPYKWATIGKEISHVEKANLDNVKSFFYKHYAPNNAILSLSGNIYPDVAFSLAEKWFGPIEKREVPVRNLPVEPAQLKEERLYLYRKVPADSIYLAFHKEGRLSDSFYPTDLISDLLGSGKSSRLNQKLVKELGIFANVDAYITGDIDPGLFIVTGKLLDGITLEKAEGEIWKVLDSLISEPLPEKELEKVKNKFEANFIYGQSSILNKAMNMGFYELLGSAKMIGDEIPRYRKVSTEDISGTAKKLFRKENCSSLFYHSEMK